MHYQMLGPSLHKAPSGEQHHQVIQTGNTIGYDKVPAKSPERRRFTVTAIDSTGNDKQASKARSPLHKCRRVVELGSEGLSEWPGAHNGHHGSVGLPVEPHDHRGHRRRQDRRRSQQDRKQADELVLERA